MLPMHYVVASPGVLPSPRHRSAFGLESSRYLAVSLFALAVDFAALTTLVSRVGVNYQIGAAAGFAAGIVIAFVLSVTWVFESHSFGSWTTGLAAFAAIGVGGLVIILVVLSAAVEWLQADYRLAKCGAAGTSFLFNFAARRVFLFTRPSLQKKLP